MKYEKTEWFRGLLYAEEMSQDGWTVSQLDLSEGWFEWEYEGTKRQVYGENEWLDGVRDYYKNKNTQNDTPFVGFKVITPEEFRSRLRQLWKETKND